MSVSTSTPSINSETQSVTEKSTSVEVGVSVNDDISSSRSDTSTVLDAPYVSEIKGLASLQDVTYSVDLEKTVQDMASIISNMETQLDKVLNINAVLEVDLSTSKKIISELRADKEKINQKLADIKIELPSKREMQMEIDQLVDERSLSQNRIHELNTDIKDLTRSVNLLQKKIAQVEMEKNDAVSEVKFLESNQSASRQQVDSQEQKLTKLKAEKVRHQKKIIKLQDECQRAMEEKYALLRELHEAQDILSEVTRAGV